ncbi:MAG: hypothetical protein GX758_00900 [Tenericutes bacterium]|nr:hypothetical protein [Mycoplasmatota bacterium]
MLKILKTKTESGYLFKITTEEGSFEISFEGNLDLYFRNVLDDNTLYDEPYQKTFRITKENYFLYSLFEELYNKIKESRVYEVRENDFLMYGNVSETEENIKNVELWNKQLNYYQKQNPERLFKNNAVEWHCDDYSYNEGNILKVEDGNEEFLVTFIKRVVDTIYSTNSVRFRNSGSRYIPFNFLFMDMYNKLCNYEPENNQIHIEEYLYQKKLMLKRNEK